jgi:hypothetical protein
MALTKNERRLRIKSRVRKIVQELRLDQDYLFLEAIKKFMLK